MRIKKFLLVIFVSAALFLCFDKFYSLKASGFSENTQNNYNQMGRTINIFKSTYGDIHDFNNANDVVLRESINNNLIIKDNVFESYNRITSGNSSSEFINRLQTKLSTRMSMKMPVDAFILSAKTHFDFGIDTVEREYATSFYYNQNFIKSNYSLSIKDPKNTLSSVTLTDQFVYDLITFESTLGRYPEEQRHYMKNVLLTNYDTHFVTGAEFGGDLSLNYSAHSNSISFKTSLSSSAENYANASIAGDFGGNISVSSSFRNEISTADLSSHVSFFAKTRGGDVSSPIYHETSVFKTYDNWMSTINGNEVLINYTHLTPIWEVLPDYYYFPNYGNISLTHYKKIASEEYNKLLSQKQIATLDYNSNIKSIHSEKLVQEFTVSDAHHLTQNNFVFIRLTDKNSGPRLALVEEKGYKTIKLSLEFDAKEINDGYQYLTFYSSDLFSNRKDFLIERRFELTPNKTQTNWVKQKFDISIPVSSLYTNGYKDTPCVLLYLSASGTGNDDWQIKNISYTAILLKD